MGLQKKHRRAVILALLGCWAVINAWHRPHSSVPLDLTGSVFVFGLPALPYVVAALLIPRLRSAVFQLAMALLVVGIDLAVRLQVRYVPGSSTDAIAVLMAPLWVLVLVIPLVWFLDWIGRLRKLDPVKENAAVEETERTSGGHGT